jgi:hypothetical protein
VFENSVLRRLFGLKRDQVIGKWRKLHNEELNKFCHSKICRGMGEVKVKVKFTLEQATKAKRGSRGIAVLFR